MPSLGASLDSILTEGRNNARLQIINSWSKWQRYTGMWSLRVATKRSGERWQSMIEDEIDAAQTRTSASAVAIVDKIAQGMAERYGDAPACELRIRMYREGKSADPDVDITRVVRPVTEDQDLVGQIDQGTMLSVLQLALAALAEDRKVIAQVVHEQSAVINSLTLQNAQVNQSLAAASTTRTVGSTAADFGSSIFAGIAGAVLVGSWPAIRERLGFKDDQEVMEVLGNTLRGSQDRVRAVQVRDTRAIEAQPDAVSALPSFDEVEAAPVPLPPALPGDPPEGAQLDAPEAVDAPEPTLPADVPALPTVDADGLRAALLADPDAATKIRALLKDGEVLDALGVSGLARSMVGRL